MEINARNTSIVGKPSLIFNSEYGKLSTTQKILLHTLEKDAVAHFDKHADNIRIKMRDLSCLTAYTGKEYSLFSRKDRQYLVVGTECGIYIGDELTDKIIRYGYRWTGHTHVGTTKLCLMPSDSDYTTLKKFRQKRSVIFNSIGEYYVFEKEVITC